MVFILQGGSLITKKRLEGRHTWAQVAKDVSKVHGNTRTVDGCRKHYEDLLTKGKLHI